LKFSRCSGASRGIGLIGVSALLLLSLAGPALAHHPFGMAEGAGLNAWQGLVSGIGHPLLGPDHLLFLLAIGFIGLGRPVAWVLPLLATGLLGAALTQVVPLSADLAPLAEALVSLSLALEGLIALGSLPTAPAAAGDGAAWVSARWHDCGGRTHAVVRLFPRTVSRPGSSAARRVPGLEALDRRNR